jgi:hypothetical protein
MQITLHAATEVVRELLDQIDPETGELPSEYEHARSIVATKSVAVAAYIMETERQSAYLKAYAKELAERAKTAERRADWLRTYLREHMAVAGITKITDERGLFSATLAVGRDKSIDVFDAAQLPADYLREIPAKYEPDKILIGKAIDSGFQVPGARRIEKDRLTIR